ncbi:MAG: hypothetical protein JRN06_03140 [Nitrososphaerota archaeon]|nr:hypothetical protein [Nitrososphaerota archaeon]MDG7023147.1 hypothetical protein [Nitrososphaerota archaeon]
MKRVKFVPGELNPCFCSGVVPFGHGAAHPCWMWNSVLAARVVVDGQVGLGCGIGCPPAVGGEAKAGTVTASVWVTRSAPDGRSFNCLIRQTPYGSDKSQT